MAMPTSGSIGISTCPNGECSSIARAVSNSASGSLANLGAGAGRSAPYSMLGFRGFNNFDIGQTSLSYGNGGQTQGIVLYGSPALSYSVSDNQTWITTGAPVTLNFSGVMQWVTVEANGSSARSGTVTLTPAFGAARTVTINQAAGVSYTLSVSPGNLQFPFMGGVCPVGVTATAGMSWTAYESAGNLSLLNGSGVGNGTFCIRSVKNLTGSNCNATVCVVSAAPTAYVYTVTLTDSIE